MGVIEETFAGHEVSRQSLADVCALVDAEFTGTRRRDLLSGLNMSRSLFNRNIYDIYAY